MTSRLFNRTSSESSNQLHSDNDIESSKENSHRAHDRRSRSPSSSPIQTRRQHVSWHLRIAQFVDVHGVKLAILVTYLNLFYASYLFATRSPIAGRIITITFDKACEFYSSVKTDLYTVIETFNQLVGGTRY